MTGSYAFTVDRKDLKKTSFQKNLPENELLDGQCLLEIEKYAFTANNITYAVLGEDLSYFKFFPTNTDQWATVPVWGFGKVKASKVPELTVGSRFYGYFPMRDHLTVTVGKVRDTGFTDVTAHRSPLPAVYNHYSHLANDAMHKDSFEDMELVFRPLFSTSFLLDDYLFTHHFFESTCIALTSASSKTAIALAYLLQLRKKTNPELKIIGMTSAGNMDFVKSLGCYDEVYLYENFQDMKQENTTLVDFRGNQGFISQVNQHLGSHFKFASLVGLVEWEERKTSVEKTIGTVFFAPHQVKKRAKEWGLDGFQTHVAASWLAFMPFALQKFKIEKVRSTSEIESVYMKNLLGQVPPNLAYIIDHS